MTFVLGFLAVVLLINIPVVKERLKNDLGLKVREEQQRQLTPFLKDQREKSMQKVSQIEINNKPVLDRCVQLLGPILKVGGFNSSTKVRKMTVKN